MKKVYLVCSKDSEMSFNYSILQVVSSRKKAEEGVKYADNVCPERYHYYFEEPVY